MSKLRIDKSRPLTEKELIERCIRQDRQAQRELYEKYSPRMFPVCLRYVSDRDKAKDVLQEGFITLFTKIESYSGEGSFEGWIRKIFVNTALMQLRKNDVLNNSDDIADIQGGVAIDTNLIESLDGKEILKLISNMPAGFRTVFNLYIIEGFSHQEISAKLNISEGASRSQLSRARVWLQERILKMEK